MHQQLLGIIIIPVLHMSSCIGPASEAQTRVHRQTQQSSYDSIRVVLETDVDMLNIAV